MQPPINPQYKSSLCRFYLRGLCNFPANECVYAHGVPDLSGFRPYQLDEVVEYDYLVANDFTQRKANKGPRNYINLSQFVRNVLNSDTPTLEAINEDTALRRVIRNKFHRQQFKLFIELLFRLYPDALWTEAFLERQYTRAGFNKLMTRIHFNHLLTHLIGDDAVNGEVNDKYYKDSIVMPPCVKQQRTFLFRKAIPQAIDSFYQTKAKEFILTDPEVDEAKLKKNMLTLVRDSIEIPPLLWHLRTLKINFATYISNIGGLPTNNKATMLFKDPQERQKVMVACAIDFIENTNSPLSWNEIYSHVSQVSGQNHASIVNNIRGPLVKSGYTFVYLPMRNVVYRPLVRQWMENPCGCPYSQPFSVQEIGISPQQWREHADLFKHQQIQENEDSSFPAYQVYNLKTLLTYFPILMESQILSIDLEGRLRCNGFVEMMQFQCYPSNLTVLIDVQRMHQEGAKDAISILKKLIRNVLVDPKKLKIFHDCRHDSLSLHEIMETCIVNVYDTSAAEVYLNCLKAHVDFMRAQSVNDQGAKYQKDEKAVNKNNTDSMSPLFALLGNVRTPGLNDLLEEYKAPHGINKTKQLYHAMWSKGDTQLFTKRPLNPNYKEYCIRDVLDLNWIRLQQTDAGLKIPSFVTALTSWSSIQYVSAGYQMLAKYREEIKKNKENQQNKQAVIESL